MKDLSDPPTVTIDLVESVGITVSLSSRFRAVRSCNGLAFFAHGAVGQAFIYAPGSPIEISAEGRCRLLPMRLPVAELTRIAAEDHDVDLDHVATSLRGEIDPVILGALCRAHAEPAARDEADRAIVGRMLELSARGRPPRSSGGLAPARLRRVTDLVQERLANVDLAEMAAAAALSPFHFARAFATTTGRTPARYVMDRRVERALALLPSGNVSLRKVAHESGFCSASHLIHHLRTRTGVTPARIRQLL